MNECGSALRCAKCQKYLSVMPVMINQNGDSICGRCVRNNLDVTLIKNKAYEELARSVVFNCSNSGCPFRGKVGEISEHEDVCERKVFKCPVNHFGLLVLFEQCDWVGPYSSLLEHCKEEHSNLVASNPIINKLGTFILKSDNFYILPVNGFLFIIKILYDINGNNLLHSVYLIGESNLAVLFNYIVFLEGLHNVTTTFPVKTLQDETFNIENFDETDLSKLSPVLGDINNVVFKIKISITNTSCQLCNSQLVQYPIFQKDSSFLCSNCKIAKPNSQKLPIIVSQSSATISVSKSTPCCYKPQGCSYASPNNSHILKHERWLCLYSNAKCKQGCGTKLYQKNRFDHVISEHLNIKVNPITIYKTDKKYIGIARILNKRVLLYWQFLSGPSNTFTISSVVETDDGGLCEPNLLFIRVSGVNGSEVVERQMIRQNWVDQSSNWDYFVAVPFKKSVGMYTFAISII